MENNSDRDRTLRPIIVIEGYSKPNKMPIIYCSNCKEKVEINLKEEKEKDFFEKGPKCSKCGKRIK